MITASGKSLECRLTKTGFSFAGQMENEQQVEN